MAPSYPTPLYTKVMEKVLSKTDANHRLAVPKADLHRFESDHRNPSDLEVVDGAGNWFSLGLTVRKGVGGYKKPEITRGWLRFISSNKLKRHDKLIFYKRRRSNNQEEPVFTVTIRRAVRLFNVVIGYAPEE